VSVDDESALISAVRVADITSQPLFVFGGGSNVVVADEGFNGTAVRVGMRGVERSLVADGRVRLDVAAGEPWDEFVECCVAEGLAGVEALSGIPGTVGGTPIQNVGAYGQSVEQTITQVRVFDRLRHETITLPALDCRFGYRRSLFQIEGDRYIVLGVTFMLERSKLSRPIQRADILDKLGMQVGSVAPLSDIRAAVLDLRAAKGMVLNPTDHDTWSVGSFFKNPVLDAGALASLRRKVHIHVGSESVFPTQAAGSERTSVAAAWLIERAGFKKGYPLDLRPNATVSVSTKHAVALTNRGSGTTRELIALARRIVAGVRFAFGIDLAPEPAFVGLRWDA
jgi:UDP-N-acetylmuramate dehydrogenase